MVNNTSYINFDSCSTTKPNQDILDLFFKLNNMYYANSNSDTIPGYNVNNLLSKSNLKVKSLLNFNGDIIYTSGATESNNLIIQGFFKHRANKNYKKFITSKVEHPSISEVVKGLNNVEVTYINIVNQQWDLKQLENELKKGQCLISTCLVNNNTGLIANVNEIYDLCEKYDSKLHLDITQAIGKIDIDYNKFHFASMSMHKIEGLKGLGLLFKKNKTHLSPLYYGGNSFSELKPGTLNTPSCITSSKTIEYIIEKYNQNIEKIIYYNKMIREEISSINGINVNNNFEISSPFIISMNLDSIGPEILMNYLEDNNIIISSGSACSSRIRTKTEMIMEEYNFKNPKNTIRICLNYDIKKEDIRELLNKIKIFMEQK